MYKIILIAVAILLLSKSIVRSEDIYTWTDSNGTVHISQTQHPGARAIGNRYETQDAQPIMENTGKAVYFLGSINDTRYFLDRGSIQIFANDRNKYKFNLYVNDKIYTCTAWAYPSGVVGLKPQIGMPDLIERELRIGILGK